MKNNGEVKNKADYRSEVKKGESSLGKWSGIKKAIDWFDLHSGSIVAIATISLAIFTFFYIFEAHKMRVETTRLADLSIEQFKIRSYPLLLVDFDSIEFNEPYLKQKYKIGNRGELAAFDFTVFQVIFFFKRYGQISYFQNLRPYYSGGESVSALDFSKTIPPDSSRSVISEEKMEGERSIENIKSQLLFLRFKVPYDTKYSYKLCAYNFKKSLNGDSLRWQEVSDADQALLIKRYFDFLYNSEREEDNQIVKPFLKDCEVFIKHQVSVSLLNS